jgi:hypothetical protein
MRKKGLILIVFLLVSFGLFISNNIKVNGEINIGNIKEEDVFVWDIKYNNTYEPTANFFGEITHTIEAVNDDNLLIRMSYGTSYSSELIEPQNALDYLPMGFSVDILYQPGIEDIIKRISIITTDWEDHYEKWVNHDIMNYFSLVSWCWHRNFTYDGALRSIYNFSANSINYNFNEPTEMDFRITYTRKNGLMLFYDLELVGLNSDNFIDLSISLLSSTKAIGWSYLMKIIISFVSTYGLITLIGISTLTYVGIKKYIENLPEEEDYYDEYDDDDEEVDHFEKIIKEDVKDYSFIRICPFCKAEVPEDAEICPECGGKK